MADDIVDWADLMEVAIRYQGGDLSDALRSAYQDGEDRGSVEATILHCENFQRGMDKLAKERDLLLAAWRELQRELEKARVHRERKGGQQAGVPAMVCIPPSQHCYLERLARDATRLSAPEVGE